MRIVTPAIFLSASIVAGCTTTSAGTTPGHDELAGETQQAREPDGEAAGVGGGPVGRRAAAARS